MATSDCSLTGLPALLTLCGQGGKIAKFQGHYYYGGDLCMVYQREGDVS